MEGGEGEPKRGGRARGGGRRKRATEYTRKGRKVRKNEGGKLDEDDGGVAGHGQTWITQTADVLPLFRKRVLGGS